MAVTSVSSSTTASSTSSTSPPPPTSLNGTLDYNSFLKLLTAQLQFQDPTKPVDSTQYISQLASFSSVEQQTNTNSKLDAVLTSLSLTQAEGYIGRTVTSEDGTISGEVASVQITSEGPVATLTDGNQVALTTGIKVS